MIIAIDSLKSLLIDVNVVKSIDKEDGITIIFFAKRNWKIKDEFLKIALILWKKIIIIKKK